MVRMGCIWGFGLATHSGSPQLHPTRRCLISVCCFRGPLHENQNLKVEVMISIQNIVSCVQVKGKRRSVTREGCGRDLMMTSGCRRSTHKCHVLKSKW